MIVSKAFAGYIWVVLVTIFLVIIAGSVVRTTQSGMGCPDWPTCFGRAIPPTDKAQVIFQPNHNYKKGQFIIHNDSLKYAVEKFTSTTIFYNITFSHVNPLIDLVRDFARCYEPSRVLLFTTFSMCIANFV